MKQLYTVIILVSLTLVACGRSDDSSMPASFHSASTTRNNVPSEALPLSIDAIKGEWNVGPKIALVKIEGDAIVCVNENSLSSKAVIKDGKAILATDWRVQAWLLANGKVLKWSDGSAWTR